MKRKVKKYLESKSESEYSNFDKILLFYVNGEIKKLLSEYMDVKIYPSFHNRNKSVQVSYRYHNVYVVLDFFEENFCVTIYCDDTNEKDLGNCSVDETYQNDFDIVTLFKKN